MQRYLSHLLLIMVFLLIAGCATAPRKGGPGDKVRLFIKDLQASNYQGLWNSLSANTIDHLQKEKGGFQGFEKVLGELLAAAGSREELNKTEIIKEEAEDSAATVTVKFPASGDGGKDRFKQFILCRENSEWKIAKLMNGEKRGGDGQ